MKLNEDFNSHAHVERDWDFKRVSLQDYNFNSHAHVERDKIQTVATLQLYISTHTLTWSVTVILPFSITSLPFQLTRSRGA